MASGLVALLDDIATLAKAAAASVDDIAAGAAKASSKAVGVVIDDTAVTPQYVRGLSPERELPVIRRIAQGSLRNKFLIILPLALVLTWVAPWSLPLLLLCGGSYLCYEGAEKILAALHLLPEHGHDAENADVSPEDLEKQIVSSAVRTDLILSTEIMLIALADIQSNNSLVRVSILAVVAFLMTFFVYGLVGILVKMDDLGMHLVARGGAKEKVGRAIVRVMPRVFDTIGVVGTLAMLWVGGHILVSSLNDLGLSFLHHWEEHVVSLVSSAGGAVTWVAETLFSGVCGLVVGSAIVGVVTVISLISQKFHRAA